MSSVRALKLARLDGPMQSDVEAAVGHMRGASFDGMTDSMSYLDNEFGNDFIFCSRALEAAQELDVTVESHDKRSGRPDLPLVARFLDRQPSLRGADSDAKPRF